MSLRELRHEYDREVIGSAILVEIGRACSIRARKYPPTVYGRSHTWSEDEIDDLVQDVILERLLGERQIDYLFNVAGTLDAWRGLLDRQVRITLARRRVRTVVDNLLDRARKALRHDDSVNRSIVAKQTVFSLQTSEDAYRSLTDWQVKRMVEHVRAVPRQVPGREVRAPTVYSKRAFGVLIQTILRMAPGGITARDLGRILEQVLTDWVPAVLELNEASIGGIVEEPGEIESARRIARQMVSEWSAEQVTIVHGLVAGLTHVETARKISVSRPTLIKRQRVLLDRLRAAASGFSEQGQEALMTELAVTVMESDVSDEFA